MMIYLFFSFFLVECRLCSGPEKTWSLSVLLMLTFDCFEFDSIIYCRFLFLLSFNYFYFMICGSYMHGILFNFISADYWLNGAF